MKNKKLFAILTLVCFMMTLMPVAAFAAVDADTSYIYTVKNNPTVRVNKDVNIVLDLNDAAADMVATTSAVTIWVTEEGKDTPSTALASFELAGSAYGTLGTDGIWTGAIDDDKEYTITFQRPGTFYLHAAFGALTAAQLEDAAELNTDADCNKVVVKGTATDTDYVIFDGTNYYKDGVEIASINIPTDGLVATAGEMDLKLLSWEDTNGNGTVEVAECTAVKGETVTIETSSSNIEVSDEKIVTGATGRVVFDITGVREGEYEVYVACGSYESYITVRVGAVDPAYINVAKAPTAAVSIDDVNTNRDLRDIVRFVITDINGNTLSATSLTNGAKVTGFKAEKKYVTIVSQPKDSDLANDDVYLTADDKNGVYATLKFAKDITAVGTYEFKVALDNGKTAYVTVDFAEFDKPVAIVLEYAAPSIELGGTLGVKDLLFVDKNGVTAPAAGKVDLAASGYAVNNFVTTPAAQAGTLTVKFDEKYLGSTVTVTAVSERYDLMTTATIKVVAEAAGLMFTTKTAEVDVNNSIQVVLVDAQGNRTALGANNLKDTNNDGKPDTMDTAKVDINYVVLDKPEGSKVSVNTAAVDNNLVTAGSFKMNLTCNKVGTVKVQAIAKVTKGANGVAKYYTGVGEIAVGTGETGKSVVMSIGSTEMIADGKVSTVDAKPMIVNSRTYVPFRALAEAFGATVAYDQATSSVTATLNGVEVVMTVGSPVYTVNGVEKTADVAPFISDSRTYVPVRFAAEAFGITVTPTYNADGSVADVLFNM